MDVKKHNLILSLLDEEEIFFSEAANDISIVSNGLMSSTSSENSDSEELYYNVVSEEEKKFLNIIDAYSEKEFESIMRIKRTTATFLIERYMKETRKTGKTSTKQPDLEAKLHIYMFLWYITNTFKLKKLAKLFRISKAKAWSNITSILPWIISLGSEYIKWPQGATVRENINKFQQINGIPDVIGLIDSIHINITAPKQNRLQYLDHAKNYSIILQGVIDANNRFIDISCGEPGSVNKGQVFFKSGLYRQIILNDAKVCPNESFLLASASYPVRKWLIPPFQDDESTTDHFRNFNKVHASTYSIATNTFDLLKLRFQRLSALKEIMPLHTAVNFIVSACIIHNICIELNDFSVNELLKAETQKLTHDYRYEIYDEKIHDASNKKRRDTLFRYLQQHGLI